MNEQRDLVVVPLAARPGKPRRGRENEPTTGNLEVVEGLCNGLNRFGLYCPNRPMKGRTRCRNHGGKSLTGIAHPSTTHARYSTALPPRIEERYQAGLRDPALLALSDEIALVDARLADLLSRADSGEAGATWKDLHSVWRSFQRARSGGDRDKMAELLDLLDEALTRGYTDHSAWAEIGTLIDRRQRLVESERKRMADAEQTITVEEVKLVLRRVLDAVQQTVTDPQQLNAIGLEIGRLAAVESLTGALTGRGGKRSRRKRA